MKVRLKTWPMRWPYFAEREEKMKRYIWKPEIFIENAKELGYTLLALFFSDRDEHMPVGMDIGGTYGHI